MLAEATVGITFGQHMISTFVGVVGGFIFAIVLFWVQQALYIRKQKAALEKNLLKEIKFNNNYLIMLRDSLQDTLDRIGSTKTRLNDTPSGKKHVIPLFNFSLYGQNFIQQYFNQGYLYDSLSGTDIRLLSIIIATFSTNGQMVLNKYIDEWQQDKIKNAELYEKLLTVREATINAIRINNELEQRISHK